MALASDAQTLAITPDTSGCGTARIGRGVRRGPCGSSLAVFRSMVCFSSVMGWFRGGNARRGPLKWRVQSRSRPRAGCAAPTFRPHRTSSCGTRGDSPPADSAVRPSQARLRNRCSSGGGVAGPGFTGKCSCNSARPGHRLTRDCSSSSPVWYGMTYRTNRGREAKEDELHHHMYRRRRVRSRPSTLPTAP